MRTKGKHFTYIDRLDIERQYNHGFSVKEIAYNMNCHVSTLYIELKRGFYTRLNTDLTEFKSYSADIAQQIHDYKSSAKGAPLKLGNDFKLAEYIEDKIINNGFSPAVVLSLYERDTGEKPFCVSTLYSYIDKGVFQNLTNYNLLEKSRRKKRNKKKVQVKSAKYLKGESIEHRPEYINNRSDFGHWEMDTVHGTKNGSSSLLVLTERKTNFELIFKLCDLKSVTVYRCLKALSKRLNFGNIFKSITIDNGSEFQFTKDIEALGTKIYYCHPYSSFERGQNERQNRIIRRFFPKGQSLKKVNNVHTRKVADWINNLPRKIYNWLSSKELFLQELRNNNLSVPFFV